MKKRKGLLIDILIIFSPIALMLAFVWFSQNRFLYNPSFNENAYASLKASNDDRIEEIFLHEMDESYHGCGRRVASDVPTILYFGGNFESSEVFFTSMDASGRWKYFERSNVVMIDYPGYGLSEGKNDYRNILKMADAAYRFVSESDFYGGGEIIIMGLSLGTGVATYVASSNPVEGLILMAPYNNGTALYNSQLNIFHGPIRLLVRNPFPSEQFALEVTAPTLIFASEDDEVIPYELSVRLVDAFDGAEFVTLKNLCHTEIFWDNDVLRQIEDFVGTRR